MSLGFTNLPFQVSTSDGRNFILLVDAFYTAKDGSQYCMPVGATSDGASTPPEVWQMIPPFGLYWPAAFLHDCAYRNTLQKWIGSSWVKCALMKAECDNLLHEAMESLGVSLIERDTIYEAVVLAGASSFESDRAPSA